MKSSPSTTTTSARPPSASLAAHNLVTARRSRRVSLFLRGLWYTCIVTWSTGRRSSTASGSLFSSDPRLWWLCVGFCVLGLGILARFFQLQVLEHESYKVLASGQHTLERALIPRRGTIYIRDRLDGALHPIATDRDAWQIYAVPREMKDRASVAEQVSQLLHKPKEEFLSKLMSPTTTYMVLDRDAAYEVVEAIRQAQIPGIGVQKGLTRLYPEHGLGGQMLGFVSLDEQNQRVGRYGLEGYFDDVLRGKAGRIEAERDASGRRLTIGSINLEEAQDGSDIVLTIDRQIQYIACAKIQEAVQRFGATGGSVVIVRPQDGSVLAMCSAPDFDPAQFRFVEDIAIFNNPVVSYNYEPGSIFKPVTLAAGIDAGKITPRTTYTDTGEERIDDFTIRNSDKLAHGLQTMTDVLEKSLNTGTIYVQRLLGKELFRAYVEKFGFGEKTGIPLSAEAKGDVSQVYKKGDIFAATISFGQGMAATPMQMVMSYVPLANGGRRYAPRLVEEVRLPNGVVEKLAPKLLNQVISERTSRLITAMLVNVVENGHGKRAGVPGYYVAGKTGTAQIPNPKGGYLKDATIGSFVGYAPSERPEFVMLVKIDRPTTVQFAESSAAPIFGELANELVHILNIPPERATRASKSVTPVSAASVSASVSATP